ncbi:MAG: tetratricopeptide repeat protein [Halanaerobiaceae bacterium]
MKEEQYLNDTSEEIEEKYKDGNKALRRRNLEESEEIFIEIIEEDRNFAPAYNKLGVLYIFKEEYNEANTWLNKALRVDKNYTPAIMNMGNLMREQGQNRKAISYYEKAIDVDSDYGPAYNNLGVIYREEGNISKSIKYMKKARKKGGLRVKTDVNKPLYKEPGCITVVALVLIVIFLVIWLIT